MVSDLPSDIIVQINDVSYLLHKVYDDLVLVLFADAISLLCVFLHASHLDSDSCSILIR
jgi:hypothetical protein